MLYTTDLPYNVRRRDVRTNVTLGIPYNSSHRLNYTWINQDRKSVHLPAPTYIDYVMTWIQNLLDDENTFPTKSGMHISS